MSLLSAWGISGCTTITEPDVRFSVLGRFTLRVISQQGKRENISGKFLFQRTNWLVKLDLLSPLNSVLGRIEITNEKASFFKDLNEEPITAPDAETLMMDSLGFSMPVAAIEEWATCPETPKGYGWAVRVLKRKNGRPKTLLAEKLFSQSKIHLMLVFDEVFP
ncbi:outer membrane lipoprotein LolB [gut metagenome]|uniref:Outer membrane lipoprotein LolB n=1 Tax=gut metagenome TaxID=749906 RepID=J9GWR5_9ZZZZ